MLIIKKRNIQKGFSLIELMVAAAILAIAILGIFQAYNVSFMGMSDARDRTVATNYVREAMEGIKNMDFDKIITQSRSYITGSKYKYEREVIVQESTNLKKVTTKVYWRDRNGNKKMVEAGMSVHFMQTSEGTATRIMLIANPYNVLPEGTSTITAVIKDAKGNTVTTWTGGDISFSIDTANSTTSGTFSNKSGISKGKVTINFTAENTEGTVTIVASAGVLTPDSVNIKVTEPKKPVKINLTANRTYMAADTSSTSEITATIADAGGETVTESNNVITFSVSGPGTLSAITSTAPTNGIAKITLTSNGTPGTITVTASATGLEPGVVNVFTGGKISLSASRFSVPVNETSEITVTTKDVNGVPIKYVGTINLEISPNPDGAGIFENDLNTIEVYFDGSTSSNTITFTGTSEGIVNINAEDQAGILTSADPLSLTITLAPVPDHIAVTADPSCICIKAEGTETSTITARVKTADNKPVISYNESVTFTTTAGSFSNIDSLVEITTYFIDGVATVELYPSVIAGVATITVCSPSINNCSILGNTNVRFYIEADHIELVANPQNIPVGGGIEGTCTITATIKDGETTVTGYSGTVEFSKVSGQGLGTLSSNTATVFDGKAYIYLESKQSTGTVRIKATSEFTDCEGGTTEIEGYLDIDVVSIALVPHHIVLSAEPSTIQANGTDTSIISAIIVDTEGNIVTNYNKPVTFYKDEDIGEFTDNDIIPVDGVATVEISSEVVGSVEITASSKIDEFTTITDNGSIPIEFTEIPTELTLGDVINEDNYNISFGIIITGPSLHLDKMQIEWDNKNATLVKVKINSEDIASGNFSSICIIESINKELLAGDSDIRFTFSGSSMKNKNITVTFTDENGVTYEVSFKVPT